MPGPGRYWGTKPRGTLTKSAQKGTPSIAIVFEVAHQANNGEWVAMPNAYDRTVYLYLSDAALPFTEEKLEKLGFNGNFDNPEFTAEGVELECRMETYEGKQREKWEIAGGSFTPEKADDETVRHWNRIWKSRQTGKAKVPAGKPASPPAKAPATGDQIPF